LKRQTRIDLARCGTAVMFVVTALQTAWAFLHYPASETVIHLLAAIVFGLLAVGFQIAQFLEEVHHG